MLCGKCGASLVLVGRAHRCVMPPAYDNRSVEQQQARVAHTHEVAGAAPATATNGEAPPQDGPANMPLEAVGTEVGPSTYRYRDPEKRRAYMRGYMARRRATAPDQATT
jgi:hypothetical protein